MTDTDAWTFVEAKHFGPARITPVRLIVIHTAEWPEGISGAEGVAHYFATMPDGRVASAHIVVDSDSIVQCVKDSDVAWAAPGANHDGIQVELACQAEQSPAQWRDHTSISNLALAADAVAQYCIKYGVPSMHLSDVMLLNGAPGIVGHDQVSRVYKKSTHTDPGPNFPWSRFMLYVKAAYVDRT